MPKGVPNKGINSGWFDSNPRPDKRTGITKTCLCGKPFYCEKSRINRKKYCSTKCRCDFHPKGAKFSPEAKKRISLSKIGVAFSTEHKKNIGLSSKGRIQSQEARDKNRLSQIKRYDIIGRKEHKRYYHFCSTKIYIEWRNSVFLRDKWSCRICRTKDKLQAHHILGWSSYPELRYDINNGITLCHAHHPRKKAEEKRLCPYFKELVSVSK